MSYEEETAMLKKAMIGKTIADLRAFKAANGVLMVTEFVFDDGERLLLEEEMSDPFCSRGTALMYKNAEGDILVDTYTDVLEVSPSER